MTLTTRDARALVEKASEKAGKTPKVIVTDKLQAYIDGIELAFGADTKHIAARTLTSERGKQFIERFHGTLKQRTKIMRGLKSRETAQDFLDGWLVHYNYLRPHEGLADSTGNHTPADKAGIKFPYKTWLDMVKALPQPKVSNEPQAKATMVEREPIALELHHPKSATATLWHFAGHPKTRRIRDIGLGAGVVRSRGRQHIRLLLREMNKDEQEDYWQSYDYCRVSRNPGSCDW